jgi:simple sugar transport system ATP-binding protein
MVRLVNITKRFPGVTANDCVSLEIRRGEVHALLGENGAGKSTLMSVLSGLYAPDEGTILIEDRSVTFHSPAHALRHGIGMVYQHFMLVPTHTVAENIFLGHRDLPLFFSSRSLEGRVKEASERWGLTVEPGAKIWQLSVGEQQRVEILKVLMRGAEILILDEPTAVLTPQEASALFSTIRSLTAEGKCVVFISHKMDEVMDISNRITVLGKGRVVGARETAMTTKEELARMMVGKELLLRERRAPAPRGDMVLRIEGLSALGDRGTPALRDVSLSLRAGEIMGLAGVAGNGQRELAAVLAGMRSCTSGKVFLGDEEVTNLSVSALIDRDVRFIPEDRMETGLAAALTCAENLALREFRRPPLAKGPFLDYGLARRILDGKIEEFSISVPVRSAPAGLLSGGNLQKLILARELAGSPRLILALYPTRGLDIGATRFVHECLFKAAEQGAAILLVSEDLDEISDVCNTAAVICRGRIVGVRPADGMSREEIGLMMSGVSCAGAL